MTLYRETSCEHGNLDCRMAQNTDRTLDCPGGFREEVVIDYEAAYDLYNELADQLRQHSLIHSEIKSVVDAALHST